MSKKYSEPEQSTDYTESSNFPKDKYTHADAPVIEDRYTKPKKRRHTFTEVANRYRKANHVAKNKE